jgi:hypothetical protein
VRQRRTELRDSLEPLGAKAQRVDPLLIRDVLEDCRRGSIEVARFPIGVCRGDADRKSPKHRRYEAFRSRRANLMLHRSLERLGQLRCDLADSSENWLANVRSQARA